MKFVKKKNLSSLISRLSSRRGFTLIELLVVIAILGILAGGVMMVINPAKRINQAKDTKIKSDISQIAQAEQVYYNSTGGGIVYTFDATKLDLKSVPTPPDGGIYTINCNNNTNCTEIVVYTALKDPTAPGNVWCWQSSTGQATEIAVSSCITP